MSCDLSNILIEFVKSGTVIRPFSIDIRRSRQDANDFDHVQAMVTKESGQHIINNHTIKEPVKIHAEDSLLYRGWYPSDGVEVGESQSVLKINDPRKLLKRGTVDQEWDSITLKNAVNYVTDQFPDPHNVIKGVRYSSGKKDTKKLQHPTTSVFTDGGRTIDPSESKGYDEALRDFIKEITPYVDGDGNFDFREETPYNALSEICEIWETAFWIDQNGELVIGHPDSEVTVYGVGRGPKNWHLSEWNIPANPTPLKGVIVKGMMDEKGGNDSNAEELWNVITNKKEYETRAAAGFLDDDSLSEVIVLDGKKETNEPKVLKEMARRRFLEEHTKNNRGSITINCMVDNKIPASQYAEVDIGDHVFINNIDSNCNKLKEGVYSIHSIQHDITGSDGWSITLEINKSIMNSDKLKERFWYFDPTNPEMTENYSEKDSVDV